MTDYQFSLALMVSNVSYLAIEIPEGLILKRVGANIPLPTTTTLCGLITILQDLVTSYQGLLAVRFFLGLAEGGMVAVIPFIMCRFYRRDQIQSHVTLIFTGVYLVAASSGMLASGHFRGW